MIGCTTVRVTACACILLLSTLDAPAQRVTKGPGMKSNGFVSASPDRLVVRRKSGQTLIDRSDARELKLR
jgi:hypothetical protein